MRAGKGWQEGLAAANRSISLGVRWTNQQLIDYELRQKAAKAMPVTDEAVEDEGELHADIKRHCDRMGWRYVNSRMDKRSRVGEGVTDFIIAADKGRTFWIECKSRTGKLSLDQLAFITWLEKLGHEVAVVDSMAGFLEAVK